MKTRDEIIEVLNKLPPAGVGNVTDKIREKPHAVMMADDLFLTTNAKRMLETGTHKGGSATLWLSRNDDLNLLSIDIGSHWVSAPEHVAMEAVIQAEFPGRFTFIRGDSTDPVVIDSIKHLSFDLMFVDGDHSYPYVKKDIELAQALKIPFVLLDDWNTCEDVRRAAADTGLVFVKEYPDIHNDSHISCALFRVL